MALNLGELYTTIDARNSGFKRGLRDSRADMAAFQGDTNRRLSDIRAEFASQGDKAGRGFAKGLMKALAGGVALAGIASAAAGAASSIGPLIGLVGVLAVAVGTLAAAIPAFAVGGAVAIATLTIGFSNLGDAIAGDEEALEKLAPAAREVVGVLKTLKPAWESATKSIQQELFKGLGDDIAKVASVWIPLLKNGLGKVAGGFNSVASAAAKALTQTTVIKGFNDVTDATAKGLKNFSAGVAPWLEGIGILLSSFAPLLERAGTAAANLGTRFAEFIAYKESTGQIADFIAQMQATFTTLGGIASNVGSILFNVFAATSESGGGLLGTIESLTGQFADFLASAEGWETLNTFFSSLEDVGAAVLPIVLALASAFANDLSPVIGDIATAVGPSLRDLVEEVGDALGDLDISTAAEGFSDVLDAINPLIGPLGDLVAGTLELDGLVPVIAASLAVWTAAQWALNTALWANPIALLVGLIIVLIAAVVLLIMNWEQVSATFGVIWRMIVEYFERGKTAVGILLEQIKNFFVQTWTSIVASIQSAVDEWLAAVGEIAAVPGRIAAWLTDMKDRAVAKFQEFVSAAGTKIDAVLGVIQRLGGIPGKIAGFVQSAKDQAVSKFQSLVDWVKGLPDKIKNAIGDLGSLLKGVGGDIIDGLLDGIQDGFGAVQDKLGELTSMLPSWKGPASVDRVLLRGPAELIMSGFADSLTAGIPGVARPLRVSPPRSAWTSPARTRSAWRSPPRCLKRIVHSCGSSLRPAT